MSEVTVLDVFKVMFPLFTMNKYTYCGENSIFIEASNGMTMIFTFKNASDWRLEAVDTFGKEVLKEITNE